MAKPVCTIHLNCVETHTSATYEDSEQKRYSATKKKFTTERSCSLWIQALRAKLNSINLFIQFNIPLSIYEIYKIKCFKLLDINGQKKV